jgi:hypothetical protein
MVAAERELLARAKRQRAGLRVIWEQARGQIPARRQAWLAIELAKIRPVLIQRNGGPRVPCEKPFRLSRPERQELATGMLREGATRDEVLATVEISPATLRKVIREASAPNRPPKPHSHAVRSDVSATPAVRGLERIIEPQNARDHRRPDWHAWVYGAARNPIHGKRGRA